MNLPGPAGPTRDPASMTYEQLVDALEQLTRRMADGDIGIEEAVELYERAGHLHALASERLARVQERIERLSEGGSSLDPARQPLAEPGGPAVMHPADPG